MIERAGANADHAAGADDPRPSFVVGDVAALPFPDGSFGVVVSWPWPWRLKLTQRIELARA